MSKSTDRFLKTKFDMELTWIGLADVDLDIVDASCPPGDPSFGLGGVPTVLHRKQTELNPGLEISSIPFNEDGPPESVEIPKVSSARRRRSNPRSVWVEPAGNSARISIEKPEVEGDFNCDDCRKRLSSRFYLANHKDRFHRIFKCKECGLPLPGSRFLRSHLLKEHNYRRPSKKAATIFMCYVCKKIFKSKDRLEFHVQSLHDKTPCHLCGKLLFRRNLERHLRTVHPSKEKREEDVVYCFMGNCNGRRMTEKYKGRHQNLFHRQFRCDKCSKEFEGRKNYRRHLKNSECFNENKMKGETFEVGEEVVPFCANFKETVKVEPMDFSEFHNEYGLFNAEYNSMSIGLAGLEFDNLFQCSTSVEDIFGN